MDFIEAILAIDKREDLELCTDETELSGERSSICVYKDGIFCGKLRWPLIEWDGNAGGRATMENGRNAYVDEELVEELTEKL